MQKSKSKTWDDPLKDFFKVTKLEDPKTSLFRKIQLMHNESYYNSYRRLKAYELHK